MFLSKKQVETIAKRTSRENGQIEFSSSLNSHPVTKKLKKKSKKLRMDIYDVEENEDSKKIALKKQNPKCGEKVKKIENGQIRYQTIFLVFWMSASVTTKVRKL